MGQQEFKYTLGDKTEVEGRQFSVANSASERPPTGGLSSLVNLTASNTKPQAPYVKRGPGGIFSSVFTSYKRSTPLHPDFQVTDL